MIPVVLMELFEAILLRLLTKYRDKEKIWAGAGGACDDCSRPGGVGLVREGEKGRGRGLVC